MSKIYTALRFEGDQDNVIAVFTSKEKAELWVADHPQNTGNLAVGELPLNPPPAASLYRTRCPNGCGPMPAAGRNGTECPICKFTHYWPWPEDNTNEGVDGLPIGEIKL